VSVLKRVVVCVRVWVAATGDHVNYLTHLAFRLVLDNRYNACTAKPQGFEVVMEDAFVGQGARGSKTRKQSEGVVCLFCVVLLVAC